jgi:pilus assembly protein CpaD
MPTNPSRARARFALTLALFAGACGGMPENRSLDSVHQPVIERSTWALDLAAGPGGLDYAEQRRLAEWFAGLDLRYGDRVAIDDPAGNIAAREAIAALAGRYGVPVGETSPAAADAPVPPRVLRVVVSRSVASVPGCPDWSDKSETNLTNGTHSNFGCAINANLAAMVADPEHLIHGASDGGTTPTLTATKAIESYRKAPPTGEGGLTKVSSTEGSGAQ